MYHATNVCIVWPREVADESLIDIMPTTGGSVKGACMSPNPSVVDIQQSIAPLLLSQWMPFRISSPHTTSVAECVARWTRVWTNCRLPFKPTYRRSKLKKHDRCGVRYGQRLTVGQLGSGAGQYPSINCPKVDYQVFLRMCKLTENDSTMRHLCWIGHVLDIGQAQP